MAASTVAAAEVGRKTGGFQRLAKLPIDIGNRLPTLFQPAPTTRPLFDVFLSVVRHHRRRRLRLLVCLSSALVKARFATFAAATAVTFLLIGGSAAPAVPQGGSRALVVMGLAAVAVAVGSVAATVSLVRLAAKEIPRTGYGLCPGSEGAHSSRHPAASKGLAIPQFFRRRELSQIRTEAKPLTDWLTSELDALAGLKHGEGPLTFGDLWGPRARTRFPYDEWSAGATRDLADCDVNLEMMTTNLTLARPLRLPFETQGHYFCLKELEPLFPRYVIDRLTESALANEGRHVQYRCPDHHLELLPLPAPPDLPLVVATRLSLSFPILVSAVPLFTSLSGPDGQPEPLRCWFSDGGISTNFPIHFFDALWPVRPTFGLTLGKADDHGSPVVFHPAEGPHPPRVRHMESICGFLTAIVDTVLNWAPEGQAALPGYRERIAEIRIQEGEGNLNVAMSRDAVLRLAVRGWQAGNAIQGSFSFDRHRWIRYLTVMSKLEQSLRDMQGYYVSGPNNMCGYRSFVSDPGEAMIGYERDDTWRRSAIDRTDVLLSFLRSSGDELPFFAADAPRPDPDLRLTARY